MTRVECFSTHLTSFAVLVSVAGLQVYRYYGVTLYRLCSFDSNFNVSECTGY